MKILSVILATLFVPALAFSAAGNHEKAIDTAKNRPQPSDEKISTLLESLSFTVLETKDGKATVAPSDPVGAADTQLHFDLKPGDVVVKAAPRKGDHILFQLRPGDGTLQVVAEYLD